MLPPLRGLEAAVPCEVLIRTAQGACRLRDTTLEVQLVDAAEPSHLDGSLGHLEFRPVPGEPDPASRLDRSGEQHEVALGARHAEHLRSARGALDSVADGRAELCDLLVSTLHPVREWRHEPSRSARLETPGIAVERALELTERIFEGTNRVEVDGSTRGRKGVE